jgi:hypothetical protein
MERSPSDGAAAGHKKEDDLDNVVFEDEIPPPAEATRCLEIARVLTDGEYFNFWFFNNMKTVWDLAQQVETWSLEDNLHTSK